MMNYVGMNCISCCWPRTSWCTCTDCIWMIRRALSSLNKYIIQSSENKLGESDERRPPCYPQLHYLSNCQDQQQRPPFFFNGIVPVIDSLCRVTIAIKESFFSWARARASSYRAPHLNSLICINLMMMMIHFFKTSEKEKSLYLYTCYQVILQITLIFPHDKREFWVVRESSPQTHNLSFVISTSWWVWQP